MQDVYLDNAATTYPKPEQVYEAMDRWHRDIGGNPGRSGHHRAVESGRTILRARTAVAKLLGAGDSSRVIFTKNATEALNLGIKGILKTGDHALTSCMEHNSVWRPLEAMRARGVDYSRVDCDPGGGIDIDRVAEAIRPNTRLLCFMHASNVTGGLFPLDDLAALARERGIPLLVDAAQTAGCYPIDVEASGVDMLAFTGHKELFGPQGTGGLYLREGVTLEPLLEGGTGSNSRQPVLGDFLPDRFESGTPNGVGLAGLAAGVEFLLEESVAKVREHARKLTLQLLEGLRALPGVELYGPDDWEDRVGIVSFNIEGFDSAEAASLLDERYGICARSGLHCSPLAHATIGTLERGTVRAGMSYLTPPQDVDYLIDCVRAITTR
ncbi:MAG: aminotransferase class V-fold PLP-dependent enzyme [Candidatus Geothermincolia bacterium]